MNDFILLLLSAWRTSHLPVRTGNPIGYILISHNDAQQATYVVQSNIPIPTV